MLIVSRVQLKLAPSIRGSGICGMVSVAEPLDACSPLTNELVSSMNGTRYPFVLIIRGGCSYERKVRRAQAAGFEAAIVYDNGTSDLVASNVPLIQHIPSLKIHFLLNIEWIC